MGKKLFVKLVLTFASSVVGIPIPDSYISSVGGDSDPRSFQPLSRR